MSSLETLVSSASVPVKLNTDRYIQNFEGKRNVLRDFNKSGHELLICKKELGQG
jgi:hypothetical protein